MVGWGWVRVGGVVREVVGASRTLLLFVEEVVDSLLPVEVRESRKYPDTVPCVSLSRVSVRRSRAGERVGESHV